jgi:hypothetical protein
LWLHDLRHGQASLMLAAGVPLAVMSKRLGHSSVSITSDTYSHLLEGVCREAAERAAALVPRNRREQFVSSEAPVSTSAGARPTESPGEGRGAPGDRTRNPRIKRPKITHAEYDCLRLRAPREALDRHCGHEGTRLLDSGWDS